MLNDMPWRKMPRDLLTNPKICAIANRVKPELQQAVFLFYIACYTQANDDGIIDISDTETLADLIRLDNENDVAELAYLFIRRGFFEPITDDLTLLLITDWDNPQQASVKNGHRISETQDQRRKRINSLYNKAPKNAAKKSDEAAEDTFLCVENDKISKSVATDELECDKNAKSVTLTERKERKDKREKKEHTHTEEDTVYSVSAIAQEALQEDRDREPEENESSQETMQIQDDAPTFDGLEDYPPQEEEVSPAPVPQYDLKDAVNTQDTQWNYELTKKYAQEMSIPDGVANKLVAMKSYEDWQTAGVLYAFFAKNHCPGLNTDNQLDQLQLIVLQCTSLAELKNPSYVIAGQLCSAMQNLVNNTGSFAGKNYEYFKGMLLTPENMLKNCVFGRVLNEARRVLNPGKTAGQFWTDAVERMKAEADAENGNGEGFLSAEYTKNGINPAEAGATTQLIAMISRKQKDNTG